MSLRTRRQNEQEMRDIVSESLRGDWWWPQDVGPAHNSFIVRPDGADAFRITVETYFPDEEGDD